MHDMLIQESEDTKPFLITHKWLREYNARVCSDEFTPVRLVAYDDANGILGSLDGSIEWAKLHIDNLVVHPNRRNQGIGKSLMQKAEQIARDRGCTGIYLDTMSFQALGFYTGIGFQEVGAIAGFAGNATKYFLHKAIQQDGLPDAATQCQVP